ncbi:hypothetical protein H8K32_13535 [Undibacterium jejuense]|uniref:BAAT/Acyl-CoA thioester hydrolase C-terminal domain-containing protein n=1 Tax=Undibacterium jejuense TaxID=1344949 RepID=A0A923KIR7_9BURK|nr:alpha/beta hydrolase [Undibacterium jejuense]MBC3863127.1 hypothetical protein [Undibacterium jejuense]
MLMMKKDKVLYLYLYLYRVVSLILLLLVSMPGVAGGLSPMTMNFDDGGSAIYYSFDKSITSPGDVVGPIKNLIFVIAGSGCGSMGRFLPEYFTGLEGESGRTRIFVLQKRFIAEMADGQKCSDDFVRADHISQWHVDQLKFIRARLAEIDVATGRVVLLGISEGAELVPLIAADLPQVTHMALLSHSGMNAGRVYHALAADYPHMARGWQELQTVLASRPADPDGVSIHSRSWRYWKEILDLPETESLLASKLPILLGAGGADRLIPAHSLDQLRHQFIEAGNDHLRILQYPLADHGLMGPTHNYLPDFMWQLDLWLSESKTLTP